jgi:hypothetical protein
MRFHTGRVSGFFLVTAVAGIAATISLSCMDASRPRANPFDPGTNHAFEIVAIKDTVRAIGDWALFHVKPEEEITDPFLSWSSANQNVLAATGTGAYRLINTPPGVTSVWIRVRFMSQLDSALVVIDL